MYATSKFHISVYIKLIFFLQCKWTYRNTLLWILSRLFFFFLVFHSLNDVKVHREGITATAFSIRYLASSSRRWSSTVGNSLFTFLRKASWDCTTLYVYSCPTGDSPVGSSAGSLLCNPRHRFGLALPHSRYILLAIAISREIRLHTYVVVPGATQIFYPILLFQRFVKTDVIVNSLWHSWLCFA